jgi:hypothetical protein
MSRGAETRARSPRVFDPKTAVLAYLRGSLNLVFSAAHTTPGT